MVRNGPLMTTSKRLHVKDNLQQQLLTRNSFLEVVTLVSSNASLGH